MKKVLNNIIECAIVVTLLIILPGIVGWYETRYEREGVVITIEGTNVIICDTTDNEWVFEGEGFIEGDLVIMRMFDNGTHSNIYDDKIDNIKIIK